MKLIEVHPDYATPPGGCSECVYYRSRKKVECNSCASKRGHTLDPYLDDDDDD